MDTPIADTREHLRYYTHAPYQEFANHLVFGHGHEPFYVPATPFRKLTAEHEKAHAVDQGAA